MLTLSNSFSMRKIKRILGYPSSTPNKVIVKHISGLRDMDTITIAEVVRMLHRHGWFKQDQKTETWNFSLSNRFLKQILKGSIL